MKNTMGEITNQSEKIVYYRPILKEEDGGPTLMRVGKEGMTPVKGIEGYFEKVDMGEYESTDGKKELVKVYLKDTEENYCISGSRSMVMRSLLNSLAGSKSLGLLRISIYGKADDTGRMWANVSVYNDGERANWKYSIDDQKTMTEEIVFKGKKMRDYSKFEETLKKDIPSINKAKDTNADAINSFKAKEKEMSVDKEVEAIFSPKKK